MTTSTTQTNVREVTEDDSAPVIQVLDGHVTRMLVTGQFPRSDLRSLPRSERIALEGSEDLAIDVWLGIESVGQHLYVVATAYGVRLWHQWDARNFKGDLCVTRAQQLAAERKALLNL